ncbi:MAG TPA: class B sortase [Oscillospiraceae bacterium]|nr:class B sortase [Oscillospiraceae bacterium]
MILLRVVMALSAIGVVTFAYLLFRSGREYAQGGAAYEQARVIASAKASSPENASGAEPVSGIGTGDTDWEIDFSALRQGSPDVVGWIRSEDGEISYPVVLGEDNDYYLTHLFNGEKNKLGSIFMDYRCSGDFSDRNTVVYGHNMKDGSMFSSLTNYEDQGYYDDYPSMALYTPDGDYTVELFAGVLSDGSGEPVCGLFDGDGDLAAYVDSLRENSTFQTGVSVGPDDRIVTLCTCSYEYDGARYLLCGKLTPIEAAAE